MIDDELNKSEASKSSSSKGEARVSTSKSGFTGKDFLLVFKNDDGTYSTPRKVPRDTALSVARDFASNKESAKKYDISKPVAKFILARAIRKGLIAKSDKSTNDFDLSAIASDSMEWSEIEQLSPAASLKPAPTEPQTIAVGRQPKYFPTIDPYLKPDFANKTIEVVAFILTGVDPSQLQDPRVFQGKLNLRQLVQMSVARISPGLLMQDDHWYVLAHLHGLDRDAFKLVWEDAQTQATGQANTDVVKVMTKLERFKIDSSARCLADPTNKSFFLEVQDKSVELLSRNFRRIRRKIESIYEQPAPPPAKTSWLENLFKRKATAEAIASPVQTEVSDLVTEYLMQSIKIGRILRSNALKQQR